MTNTSSNLQASSSFEQQHFNPTTTSHPNHDHQSSAHHSLGDNVDNNNMGEDTINQDVESSSYQQQSTFYDFENEEGQRPPNEEANEGRRPMLPTPPAVAPSSYDPFSITFAESNNSEGFYAEFTTTKSQPEFPYSQEFQHFPPQSSAPEYPNDFGFPAHAPKYIAL